MGETGGANVVIANPRAGRGMVGCRWQDLLGRFRRAGLQVEGHLTEHPGHAAALARQARAGRRDLVVAVGGDGTVHEVVNGLLGEGARELDEGGVPVPSLGLVPAGSGCDYARNFALPADLDDAVAHLVASPARPVDIGEVRYHDIDGEAVRLFVNVAEVGIGAEVAARAARLPRTLGAARYAAAFALALPHQRSTTTYIDLPGGAYEGPLTNLVVALGQYFGGGMRIAPKAEVADGLFDVQVQCGTKADYALAMPKVFRGTHLPHPRVREERATVVEVQGAVGAKVEADGEVLGTTPATFRILPGALRVKA
ncbi:diacylglycerol kinase family lipid kinase [soil metagenome]